ncbi:ATP-binding protein [Natronorubrum sp. JWXQ-INN-674]|uniref:ATP-binding protein n=1 Tax=Natronorubrum halalkaliphilum TaxID=2691917 RepID=A0A6B0VLE2_9EURY|nr:ATP-binding protein [Natronorubrum halalkaliphilum]MXV62013.1 ATP-binding protein [Natronorubrum halalkaliphilum]
MTTKLTQRRGHENERESVTRRIAFAGDPNVGKTTVAALVAARLAERTRVEVTGEATELVPSREASTDDALGIEWAVEDCPPGVEAIGARAERLDTVFVVTTPETLESALRYERCASQHDVECFLVVNRFDELARDRLRTFDGPTLAEYFYEKERISTAIGNGCVPELSARAVEAILIEALQSERQEPKRALEALERGNQSIVNTELEDREKADSLIDSFGAAGYTAAYFECNCHNHDGHVLARRQLP